jgi:hypothetical protein
MSLSLQRENRNFTRKKVLKTNRNDVPIAGKHASRDETNFSETDDTDKRQGIVLGLVTDRSFSSLN